MSLEVFVTLAIHESLLPATPTRPVRKIILAFHELIPEVTGARMSGLLYQTLTLLLLGVLL